ncbi:MAG: tripartite tricarboxylate transporter substrate binding protein [Thermodesulfobacteriota bacterium]
MKMKLMFCLAFCSGIVLAVADSTFAQNYPNKPVRFICSYAPGGGNDTLARIIGQKLTENLGQQVVVDNRPGAGCNIATEMTAKAPPDGYTMFLADNAFSVNPSLYSRLPFKQEDLAPVTLLCNTPLFLTLNPSVPAKSVNEFITLAKSKPGQLSYGSAGNGSVHHLAMEMLKVTAGIDILHIPYKGSSEARIDLMGGRVETAFMGTSSIPFFKAGKLRALAITSSKRSSAAPEIPTFAEAGVPGFVFANWLGVVVPAKTPKEIITKLHAELSKALKAPDVRERLVGYGYEILGDPPAKFAAFIKEDTEKMVKAVKYAGARID